VPYCRSQVLYRDKTVTDVIHGMTVWWHSPIWRSLGPFMTPVPSLICQALISPADSTGRAKIFCGVTVARHRGSPNCYQFGQGRASPDQVCLCVPRIVYVFGAAAGVIRLGPPWESVLCFFILAPHAAVHTSFSSRYKLGDQHWFAVDVLGF
jgi:hypothetical protein